MQSSCSVDDNWRPPLHPSIPFTFIFVIGYLQYCWSIWDVITLNVISVFHPNYSSKIFKGIFQLQDILRMITSICFFRSIHAIHFHLCHRN
jgi:hypothetical protein